MNAEEFAKEFLNDIIEDYQTRKENTYSFCINTYADDPNLEILRKIINEAGFDLQLESQTEKKVDQFWKLIKL